ncbi:aspartic peptidase A1 family protein [Tanacetum coccineum]
MQFLKLFFFVLASLPHNVFSQINTAIMPVTKDAKTSLFKVGLTLWQYASVESSYLLDLDAPFTWEDCVMGRLGPTCEDMYACYLPISCSHSKCIDARSYTNPICPSLNITAKYGCRICAVNPVNPVSNICKISQLTTTILLLSGTNGRTLSGPSVNWNYVFSCAPSSLKRSLPEGVKGVAAFSWSTLAFPRQHYDDTVTEEFALCLPSSSLAPGVTFVGKGPVYFLPNPNLDVMSILSYTPMIRKTPKSLGYYIKINNISIRGTPITLPSLKSSPAKLSTLVTYTTFRSDIYKALLTSFSKATKHIPRVKAVQPFSLCMKAYAIGSTRTKSSVPNIDLEMESGKIWTISVDNSMKDTGNNGVSCLAFIDGGLRVEDAIVIGTYQMENNFLFFDLGNQTLGFSSSLLARGTSCSSFNTTIPPYTL